MIYAYRISFIMYRCHATVGSTHYEKENAIHEIVIGNLQESNLGYVWSLVLSNPVWTQPYLEGCN